MTDRQLRRQIAFEAARLLSLGQETDYPRAKRKAARGLGARFRPDDLPSNREVRDQLDRITELLEIETLGVPPRTMRLEALGLMRALRSFEPLLVGDALTDDIGAGSIVEIHLSADHLTDVLEVLDRLAVDYHMCPDDAPGRPKSPPAFAKIHLDGEPPCTLVVHFKSSDNAAGDRTPPIELAELGDSASIEQLERLLREELPGCDLELELQGIEPGADRFAVFRDLLEPLEEVRQPPERHPEGDVLFHSLQVFDLAVGERPFDEEFLTAALLHDVGKGVNLQDPIPASVSLLHGLVTRRTLWLIANLGNAKLYRAKELVGEPRRLLEASEDFEELMLLAELDEAGRRRGVECSDIDEAIDMLRALENGDSWEAAEE